MVNVKAVRAQILDLQDEHCKGCNKIKQWKKDKKDPAIMCPAKCRIGKKMRNMADLIEYGGVIRNGRELTKDVFLAEIEKGLTNREICEKYGINSNALAIRKNHWGIPKSTDRITKEQYLKCKREDLPDAYIAEKYEIGISTLVSYKRKWGININIKKITKSANGDQMDYNSYHKRRESGKSDHEISDLWGISYTTLKRKKLEWKKDGILDKRWIGKETPKKLTLEAYKEHKRNGLRDKEISSLYHIGNQTLSDMKKEWGVIEYKAGYLLNQGINGEEISCSNYEKHRKAGLLDSQICKLWGIHMSTIKRRKRKWLEQDLLDLAYWGEPELDHGVYSTREACRAIGRDKQTVQRWVREGIIIPEINDHGWFLWDLQKISDLEEIRNRMEALIRYNALIGAEMQRKKER